MEIAYLPSTDISCWLPFSSSPFFIEDYYGNHLLYPDAVAESKEYKALDQAIVRAQLRRLLMQEQTVTTAKEGDLVLDNLATVTSQGIIAHERIMHTVADMREAVLMVLDGLEPSSTAIFRREDAQDMLLCYAVCLEGNPEVSQEQEKESIRIEFASGKQEEIQLEPDNLVWCAAQPGEEAIIEYKLHRHTLDGKREGNIPLVFGEVGIVFDNRGRPFDTPQDTPQGRERLVKWLASLNDIRLLT